MAAIDERWEMTERADDLPAIRHALAERLEVLAAMMLGEPTLKKGRAWRWGKKSSLAVIMNGDKRGSWYDYEVEQGGGPLDLIMLGRRCNITEAIAWARTWTGVTGESTVPVVSAWREEAEAKEAAERAEAIGNARWMADWSSDRAAGPGTTYLAAQRGIHMPASWPRCIRWYPGYSNRGVPKALRWHAACPGLLIVATDAGDCIQAVQHIRLTPDGHKADDGKPVKITVGVGSGAAVRIPGPMDGPLVLAEGPETGLSVWVATGHETWITLGSVTKAVPPAGRTLVVCRDDDPLPGVIKANARWFREAGREAEAVRLETKLAGRAAADKRLSAAVGAWRADGRQVACATPWRTRRGDGSDMNDALRESGWTYVASRIDRALATLRKGDADADQRPQPGGGSRGGHGQPVAPARRDGKKRSRPIHDLSTDESRHVPQGRGQR